MTKKKIDVRVSQRYEHIHFTFDKVTDAILFAGRCLTNGTGKGVDPVSVEISYFDEPQEEEEPTIKSVINVEKADDIKEENKEEQQL